jgi:hypothetical protein
MHRFVKTFLLWLLLAALPLQGLAAAMQSSCGPTKHHDAPSAIASAQSQSDHHHDVHADHAAGHALADHPAPGEHASASCSACSSCCVGAIALPAGSMAAPVYRAAVPVAIAFPLLLADFIPGGPERPPKRITA